MHTKLQLNKQTVRYVPCIGVKIPGDESESGLHPEGGDDRYKGIMILL